MVIIHEWRSRQINFEDYPDSDGNWIALEAEQQLVFDDISEPSFDYSEVIFDEQEPEPERDQHDSPRAPDYQ